MAPLIVSFIGFAFILVGTFARATRITNPNQLKDAKPEVSSV
jgi:hypothetical protein